MSGMLSWSPEDVDCRFVSQICLDESTFVACRPCGIITVSHALPQPHVILLLLILFLEITLYSICTYYQDSFVVRSCRMSHVLLPHAARLLARCPQHDARRCLPHNNFVPHEEAAARLHSFGSGSWNNCSATVPVSHGNHCYMITSLLMRWRTTAACALAAQSMHPCRRRESRPFLYSALTFFNRSSVRPPGFRCIIFKTTTRAHFGMPAGRRGWHPCYQRWRGACTSVNSEREACVLDARVLDWRSRLSGSNGQRA